MERSALARLLRGAPEPAESLPSAGNDPFTLPGAPIVVRESDPARFKAAFARAAAGSGPVFLADPGWGESEMRQLEAIIARPPAVSGSHPAFGAAGVADGRGWLMIPSGGTSGRLKFARHDGWTLAAALGGFRRHFDLDEVNAVGVLPLHHVSGFVAWMRCALSGGLHRDWTWKDLEAGVRPELPPGAWCLSLVPTQLQRLVRSPEAVGWMRGFRLVFIGGGPIWPDLADEAARLVLPISLGYGTTETAAMAAALMPEEFLAGARGCGRAMPHARIDLAPEGLVRVAGDSIFLGYYPEWRSPGPWIADDLGEISADGRLRILGRRDAVIITGGKKVDPLEVEAALRATRAFEDIAVVGVSDPEWGQAVVACHPHASRPAESVAVAKAVAALAPHQRPKRFVAVDPWPRNAQGKVNRGELTRAASPAARPPVPEPRGQS